ncbi:MAG: hypothetical protein JRJ72_10875 [Deltaproteobacteria bacterium]|nr:hypothetical protein [Deltaproteobacteria bacterium]MBW2357093.1 hypothetical protein [Deltaproteobacteria bacterium]
MKSTLLKWIVIGLILVVMPLAGAVLSGNPPGGYLEFPPRPRAVPPRPFSWPVFWSYAVLIAAVVTPLLVTGLRGLARHRLAPPPRGRWPWWGSLALAAGAASWVLAWMRFDWFAAGQPHTFVPLWLSYIAVVNALAYRRTGRCMLTHQRRHLAFLFAGSAVFWWFFEYLNRFVQNWYYTGAEYGAVTYSLLATASFATVLPAVLGTRDWLAGFDLFRRGWDGWPAPVPRSPRRAAAAVLVLAAAALAAIAAWPNQLFALVWVAPLGVVASVQTLWGRRHLLGEPTRGHWSPVVTSAAAALVCGFFWEMWNAGSLVGWTYTVPYVQRFELFAMPILGYAGYLPFGLECAAVEELLGELSGGRTGAAHDVS